ncbi:MAG: hypothetical protein GYA51_07100, partial [Candidatus Methanofastidiosa archaeon]|nr:hypothetical protein [Candidatus Methanofastidiosa archaeon]
MNTTKWIDKSKLSKITITTLVICIFFTLLLWIVVARCSNVQLNLTGIQLIHQSHEVLILFDIIPFIISFLVYMALSRFVYMTEQIRELKQQEKDYNESVSDFIDKLSKGEFDTEYRLQGENDKLGRSILDLEHYLKKNKEAEETRHNEDNQRNWATEGLAKFSIILRQYNNKIDELSYSVITNLVKYLNVNQGGFFIL